MKVQVNYVLLWNNYKDQPKGSTKILKTAFGEKCLAVLSCKHKAASWSWSYKWEGIGLYRKWLFDSAQVKILTEITEIGCVPWDSDVKKNDLDQFIF